MGFFIRITRLLRANLSDLVSKADDSVKILDQSLSYMQDDFVRFRKPVSMVIEVKRGSKVN